MSELVTDSATPVRSTGANFGYPFAAAPDVIRSHQKDAYFQGVLLERLNAVLRNMYGARVTHKYTTETRTAADLLYLSLTTLLGNRTLGEEYCDIVQLEDDSLRLPPLFRRAAYIVSVVLVPYGLGRILPALRRRLRVKLEALLLVSSSSSSSSTKTAAGPTRARRLQHYLLENIDAITSPSPLYAFSLATFYFTGAYYHLSKRVWGLRYIFTRRLEPAEQRVGYEVLGVLLGLQIAVQAYMHARQTYEAGVGMSAVASRGGTQAALDGLDDGRAPADPRTLLLDTGNLTDPASVRARMRQMTHTPAPIGPIVSDDDGEQGETAWQDARYRLASPATMRWIESRQQRKCTLCLEPMRDPSATTCGHVFCWGCIRDWLVERPECPLCRGECTPGHVLPLRS